MKRLIIIKTGGKIASLVDHEGDYEDWIASGLQVADFTIEVVDVQRGERLPPLSGVSAIVITGSGEMVTEHARWMEHTADWVRQALAQSVPLLGICFGHQLLAYALEGEVEDNPEGLEVGTATIRLRPEAQDDPLFRGMPGEFDAQVSHQQSVLRLPTGARLLGSSDKDLHQAVAYGDCAWGVQFHPEFDAAIIRQFVAHYHEQLQAVGDSAERVLANVSESPYSAILLQRFARLAARGDPACGR